MDLEAAAAADLEHARVLVKALAGDVKDRSIAALALAFDRLDGIAEDRVESLAWELLPINDRLAATVDVAAPAIGAALRDAMPVLAKLAKATSRRSPGSAPPKPRGDVAPTQPAATAAEEARARLAVVLDKRIPLLKTGEERYVLGIVLEPETVDAQKDIYAAAEVREAAHKFMQEYQNIGLMHQGLVNKGVKILESYLAPAPFELDGTQVRKGTWLLAVRVLDDKLWGQIKEGELGGFSIGGSAARHAEPARSQSAANGGRS